MYIKHSICVIGIDLPLIHDSTRDACVAMQLAEFVQRNGNYNIYLTPILICHNHDNNLIISIHVCYDVYL